MDSNSFREMLMFASMAPKPLEDSDILRRTHLHLQLLKTYESDIKELRKDLQVSILIVDDLCHSDVL